jgi:hypothetical protein
MVVDEGVFFVEWEALGDGEGQLGGFACHFITRVVELMNECSVFCVPSDPDSFERECRVAFLDCCKESVPEPAR